MKRGYLRAASSTKNYIVIKTRCSLTDVKSEKKKKTGSFPRLVNAQLLQQGTWDDAGQAELANARLCKACYTPNLRLSNTSSSSSDAGLEKKRVTHLTLTDCVTLSYHSNYRHSLPGSGVYL